MSHQIYHTKGIVLASKNTGESDKTLTLYTDELGLLRAHARGARKLESRTRPALQDFSLSRVDLVRGREFWRVASVRPIQIFPDLWRGQKAIMVSRISDLLIRLINGEEKNEDIFYELSRGLEAFSGEANAENLRDIETVLVLRLLSHLGYVDAGNKFAVFIKEPISDAIFDGIKKNRSTIIRLINQSLKATDL